MVEPAQTPNASSLSLSTPPASGSRNISSRPITFTVPTESVTSSSAASISGATATIALLPQIAVPAPISSDVFGQGPNRRPETTAATVATPIQMTVIDRALAPTV